ncbi:7TM diverse intracellular signaling domain-containing protein [Billgrantia diversa]|uniref:7TM diverse intracellular signaling domain-containing protein n=1 Tax=Halomonas sp. MCCC 1A13316 TaxID=2733487 RepID=UPI003FA57426
MVYLGSFFVLMFTARGFAFQYWWPTLPTFNNQLVPINIGIFAFMLAVFSNSFMSLRQHAPRATRVRCTSCGWPASCRTTSSPSTPSRSVRESSSCCSPWDWPGRSISSRTRNSPPSAPPSSCSVRSTSAWKIRYCNAPKSWRGPTGSSRSWREPTR